eukprot:1504148-Amphidinium_carterae.1
MVSMPLQCRELGVKLVSSNCCLTNAIAKAGFERLRKTWNFWTQQFAPLSSGNSAVQSAPQLLEVSEVAQAVSPIQSIQQLEPLLHVFARSPHCSSNPPVTSWHEHGLNPILASGSQRHKGGQQGLHAPFFQSRNFQSELSLRLSVHDRASRSERSISQTAQGVARHFLESPTLQNQLEGPLRLHCT